MDELIAKRYHSVNSNVRVPFRSSLLFNGSMDVTTTRRQKMEGFVAQLGSLKAVAEKVGTNERYLSQIRGGRGMGHLVARKFEKAFSKPSGWMDQADGIVQSGKLYAVKSDSARQENSDGVYLDAMELVDRVLSEERKVYPPEKKRRMVEITIKLLRGDNIGAMRAILRLVK